MSVCFFFYKYKKYLPYVQTTLLASRNNKIPLGDDTST